MLEKVLFGAAVFGVVGNLAWGPEPANPLGAALIWMFLVLMIWYPVKAVLICCQTAARFKKEGRPLFEVGGLTEYDSEFARQVGEAASRANRKG